MRVCTFLLVTALPAFVLAQNANNPPKGPAVPRISAAEATKHIGETVVVTGVVAQVTVREKVTYLNLDKPYPETPFFSVIFGRVTNRFGDLPKLEGRQVEIMGKIEDYREKPQIVLNSTNQLTVIRRE